jgi:hypothetical protein
MSLRLIHVFERNADLLANFKAKNVRFVIVGSTAVRFHLPEREVDDLDVLIDPTVHNAQRAIEAANMGGLCQHRFDASQLAKPNVQWQLKKDYYLDILTPDTSINFEDVWITAIRADVAHSPGCIPVRIAGISTLIAMLVSSENPKHQKDVELLSKLK